MKFTATVAWGLEGALGQELRAMGLEGVKEGTGAVTFHGDLAAGYRACLWSRVASRVLLELKEVAAVDGDTLYDGALTIDWSEHLGAHDTLSVVFAGGNESIRHPHYGAVRVKDAVVDQIRERTGERPSVDRAQPDVQIHAHVHGQRATLAIDLSGRPLHFRERERDGGPAPLRETLAAGILQLASWPTVAEAGGLFVDPMCGSGTLAIEAADVVMDRAPGLRRVSWGFSRWRGHDAAMWRELKEEARERLRPAKGLRVFASDRDAEQVARTEANLERAGMTGEVRVRKMPMESAQPPKGGAPGVPHGLLVTNPPYGVRLGEEAEVAATWKALGDVLRRRFLGWEGWILAGDPKLAKKLGLRPKRRIPLKQGKLDARLLEVPIREEPVARDAQ